MTKIVRYFSKTELLIWSISVLMIVTGFVCFGKESLISLVTSLIGVTSLTLNAKGNPIGQFLTVVFSVLYGIISYRSAYYGEMFTYLGMTAPMAILAMISWLRNPVPGKRMEVQINRLGRAETFFLFFLSLAVTGILYFILKFFHTANLTISTISVFTSFLAAYLTFRRSPTYAIFYTANDLVLIVMWIAMIPHTSSAISMVLCFGAFTVNDIYGFVSWNKRYHAQKKSKKEAAAL